MSTQSPCQLRLTVISPLVSSYAIFSSVTITQIDKKRMYQLEEREIVDQWRHLTQNFK